MRCTLVAWDLFIVQYLGNSGERLPGGAHFKNSCHHSGFGGNDVHLVAFRARFPLLVYRDIAERFGFVAKSLFPYEEAALFLPQLPPNSLFS